MSAKNNTNLLDNYLKRFTEDKWHLEWDPNNGIDISIVIPVLNEYQNIDKIFSSLINSDPEYHKNTLVIFVINNTDSASIEIIENNQNTLRFLRDKLNTHHETTNLNFGLVDAASPGLELPIKDGGVGYARKIGMDLAIQTFCEKDFEKKIIVCLDADCTVDKNYITKIYEAFKNGLTAGYVDFEHPIAGNNEEQKAIICYEIFLRYYVLGLQYAESPFAFHTIGSTMICNAESYIRVQGMNKRKAAEDFYFMEKLAKVTEIKKISGTKIYPSGRPSNRVPFGTGQRVNRFLQRIQNEYVLYSPKSFHILKLWNMLFFKSEKLDASEILAGAGKINYYLQKFLIDNSFEKQWKNIMDHSNSASQLYKQKKFWFDGFKTLKLIHYLRDAEFPLEDMFSVLDQIFIKYKINFGFKSEPGIIPSIDIQKEYLNILREIA